MNPLNGSTRTSNLRKEKYSLGGFQRGGGEEKSSTGRGKQSFLDKRPTTIDPKISSDAFKKLRSNKFRDRRPLFDGAANGRNSSSGSRMLRILGERVRDKSRSNLQ